MSLNYLEQAIVDEEIRPQEVGRVRFQNSWWPAKCEQDTILKVGDKVNVIAIENITLIVVEA
jgi:membrane protein implicated in regulation of membrane protease activity